MTPTPTKPDLRRRPHPLTLIAVTTVLMASLGGAARAADAGDLKVVTTFTVIADMARNVAGDAATVESITKPGADIHEYQPTPGDIRRAQDADLLLLNGLELERWFERFYRNLSGVPGVVVSDGVVPLSISGGPYDGQPNPHAWMSPTNAVIYVQNIRDALVKYDPANAATYEANAAAYESEIEAAIAPVREALAQVPEDKRWLVTSEGAFSYLARDFGYHELFLWPVNADQQGTPQQVRTVIDAILANDLPTIFSESTVSDKPARQVARETGAYYGGVLYVDSLSGDDGPVPTYLDLLRVTAETIADGITTGLR